MKAESFLLDIAKISIAISGFAGVVASLRHPRDAPWEPNEIAGLKFMLEHSLAAVFAGLVPLILNVYFDREGPVWLIGSSVMALGIGASLWIQNGRIEELIEQGNPPRKLRLLKLEVIGLGLVILGAQVVNGVLWRTPTAYMVGCLWLLFVSFRQFMIFLFK